MEEEWNLEMSICNIRKKSAAILVENDKSQFTEILLLTSLLVEIIGGSISARMQSDMLSTTITALSRSPTMSSLHYITLLSTAPILGSLSQSMIYEAVWKAPPEHCGSAVANVISQLRRKIGDGYIETVVGSGYRFVGAGE